MTSEIFKTSEVSIHQTDTLRHILFQGNPEHRLLSFIHYKTDRPRVEEIVSNTDSLKNLNAEFVEDHRKLIRGYRDARVAIEANDREAAQVIAERLDREAGAHIEFEERFLYPIVAAARGEDYASRLYQEHNATLQTLIELQAASSMDEAARLRWLAGLQEGLEHAATCGTLLSHLETLPEERQAELLDSLRSLRSRKSRWSELSG